MRTQLSKFALGLTLLSPALGFSQAEKIRICDTDAAMEKVFNENPQAKARFEAAEKEMQKNYEAFEASHRNINNINGTAAFKTAALTDFTVPVVFHILHQYGPENITDQQCIDALAQVNRDYARLGADTAQIYKTFKDGTWAHTPAGYIDSHIKFMLAHKDPQGNCTSGIIHHYDTRTVWDRDNTPTNILYGGLTWPATKYLNIIVVKEIKTASATGGGVVVGYTYRPGTWPANAAQDAIVYTASYLGGLQARALSHEIGHWLGLPHVWGNTNSPNVACGDDGIYDTPKTKGHEFTCPNSANSNTCVQGAIPTVNGVPVYATGEDNVQNFMDYSQCPGNVQNFTTGQTYYMSAVLSGTAGANLGLNPAGANRPNVVSSANLIATDVNGTSPCTLVADWISTNLLYTVCSGGSLNMKDCSYNGTPTSWQWAANNGATIASPTSSITNITFPTVGVVTVTLTVTNSNNVTSSLTRTVQVVDATPGAAAPLTESFESGLPITWSVVNPDPGSSEWQETYDAAAYHGNVCFFLEGANAGANQTDYFYLPIVDMESSADKTFNFAYAYARANSTQNDVLKVQASLDCGASWGDLASFTAQQMANNSGGGTTSEPYYPGSADEWYKYTVQGATWNQYRNSPHLLIRFAFTEGSTGGGNNMFIDAINLGGTVGLSELAKSISLNMYPNPTNGETVLEFNLADASSIKVNVADITGRVVLNVANTNFAPGEHSISINENSTLERGVYFVNMTVNGKSLTRKLLID